MTFGEIPERNILVSFAVTGLFEFVALLLLPLVGSLLRIVHLGFADVVFLCLLITVFIEPWPAFTPPHAALPVIQADAGTEAVTENLAAFILPDIDCGHEHSLRDSCQSSCQQIVDFQLTTFEYRHE